MKKVVSISVVITLLMLGLLMLSSGTVRAGDTLASPHFQKAATPTPAPGNIPITGRGSIPATATLAPVKIPITGGGPSTIPITGGEADLSGAILLIGAGALLVASGLVVHKRRRTRA